MGQEISLVKITMGAGFRPTLKERFAPLMSLLLVCGVTFKLKKRRNMPGLVL